MTNIRIAPSQVPATVGVVVAGFGIAFVAAVQRSTLNAEVGTVAAILLGVVAAFAIARAERTRGSSGRPRDKGATSARKGAASLASRKSGDESASGGIELPLEFLKFPGQLHAQTAAGAFDDLTLFDEALVVPESYRIPLVTVTAQTPLIGSAYQANVARHLVALMETQPLSTYAGVVLSHVFEKMIAAAIADATTLHESGLIEITHRNVKRSQSAQQATKRDVMVEMLRNAFDRIEPARP